jgi:hypothetical protein
MTFMTWRFRDHHKPGAPFAGRCTNLGGAHWTFNVSTYYRWPFISVLFSDPSGDLKKQFKAAARRIVRRGDDA